MSLFNLALSEELKEKGMAQAASRKKELLKCTQEMMVFLAGQRSDGIVHADDARQYVTDLTGDPFALGNAMGSVFRGGAWEQVGRRKSAFPDNHAHESGLWRLRQTGE
jgi:hypothetical protein